MHRFKSIEGLRGWLAWTVVASHIALTSNLHLGGVGRTLALAGENAVLVFVIISGFVITHLLIERREPYFAYLTRRYMRLFPLFAVTSVAAFFTSSIYANAVVNLPWSLDPSFAEYLHFVTESARSMREHFWWHFWTAITLAHGTVSENAIPYLEYSFNPPSWSISLEWQFYLIAPLALFLLRRGAWSLTMLTLAVVAAGFAYRHGVFGVFERPGFLPASASYFGIGIASRLAVERLHGALRNPLPIIAVCAMLLPLGWSIVPLLAWTVIYTGIVLDREAAATTWFIDIFERYLESPAAVYFGSRSYSVYLSHWPIFSMIHVIWWKAFPASGETMTFLAVVLGTVPLTLIASELLYRGVELPGITLGSVLARSVKEHIGPPLSLSHTPDDQVDNSSPA